MNKAQVIARLKRAMLDELYLEDVTEEDLADDARLFDEEGVGLDSLDAVELVVLLEKHFGTKVASADEVSEAFATLSSLADFILGKNSLAQKGGQS